MSLICRYLSLKYEKDKRSWTKEEDLLLLRGFGVHGEKWSLISMFFLPQRNRKEIRARFRIAVIHPTFPYYYRIGGISSRRRPQGSSERERVSLFHRRGCRMESFTLRLPTFCAGYGGVNAPLRELIAQGGSTSRLTTSTARTTTTKTKMSVYS